MNQYVGGSESDARRLYSAEIGRGKILYGLKNFQPTRQPARGASNYQVARLRQRSLSRRVRRVMSAVTRGEVKEAAPLCASSRTVSKRAHMRQGNS